METPTLREQLSFWWLMRGAAIRRVAVTLAVSAALAGLGYLIDRAPRTVLDYARVLAWPLVALLALALFRNPIFRLFRGIYLKEANVPFGLLRFGERQEASDSDALSALAAGETSVLPMDEAAELDMLRYGTRITGALLQAFQMQIDFLKILERAPEGLTRSAGEEWFRDELRKKQADLEQWDVPPLVAWMEDNELVTLDPDGRLIASEHGKDLLKFTDAYWYAPKLI